MDNPQTLATLDTQDTGRRQTKQTNTTHHSSHLKRLTIDSPMFWIRCLIILEQPCDCRVMGYGV